MALPNLECLEKKVTAIGKCKHYVLNDADITKIVEEKSRFRKAPINYAVTKNELLKEMVRATRCPSRLHVLFSRKSPGMITMLSARPN